ncbi:MAG: Stk1 family PASTA domain-containing Ser/Thr kinase [Peptostreptococcaceae bacterium]
MGETVLGNRYEIIRKIGDGGMAFVYEAKDNLLNRTVAVKVLRPEFVDDEEFLGKFKREAEAVASLSHQNIVNVYDVGQDGKVHYIVMEFVDGQNLKEIIKNEGTLDEYTALDIAKQIAQALSAAHRKGIIHRDIKPHNILISNEGRIVKVADFGIAKAVSNSTMTNIGSIIGSVHYFSPEQAKGKFVANNADLYSLGIVLYEMLIGRVPFRGDSPISIALQHINDEIEFTSEEKINIPQSVRTIIKKLTEKSSSDRYQSAEELIEDIEYIERNIDLDFIKEYDNFATMKYDENEVNNVLKTSITQDEIEENDEDDIEDEIVQKDIAKKKKGSKAPKSPKKDVKKTRKRLKIAASLLAIVLFAQVFFIGRFILGNKSKLEGQIVTPDVQNMSWDDAQRELDRLGLKPIIRDEFNPDVPKDHVISQTPLPGADINKGDTVTIVLSRGSKNAEVPNVVGFTLGEAENILKENKLQLGNIKYENSDIYKNGVVLDQSPKSGSASIEEGDKIDLIVSKGPKSEEKPEIEQPTIPEGEGDTSGNNNGSTDGNNGGTPGGNNGGTPGGDSGAGGTTGGGSTDGTGGTEGGGSTGGTEGESNENTGGSGDGITPPTTTPAPENPQPQQ